MCQILRKIKEGGRPVRWMFRKVDVPLVAGGRPYTRDRMSTFCPGGRGARAFEITCVLPVKNKEFKQYCTITGQNAGALAHIVGLSTYLYRCLDMQTLQLINDIFSYEFGSSPQILTSHNM
jgi:hypothetical protein